MPGVGKVEFCRKAGYPNLRNTVWSWGATSDEGSVLLLVWEDDSTTLDKGIQRVWVWGSSPSDSEPGGAERREHLDRISAGAQGVVAFCTSNDRSHARIDSINEVLFRVVEVEKPDSAGRVHVIAWHPKRGGSAP